MLRPLSMVVVLAATTLGLIGDHPCFSAPPGGPYVKVEVRGELRRGRPARPGQTVAPLLIANGLEFELDLGKTPPPARELDGMYGKTVVVQGTLEKRRDTGGQEHLICRVEGRMNVADTSDQGPKPEFLIGYKEGHHEAVKQLCERLGLKVLEHYKPGQYLRAASVSGADPEFLSKLRKSDAVRYVEPNSTYEIPRGEDLPTTPRRP